MSDPARVFEAAMRAATLPDRHDDAITGVLTILRQSRDKMAALDSAVEQASDSLAPIFSALLFLVRRDALPTGFGRQLERFLAGGKIRPATYARLFRRSARCANTICDCRPLDC